MTHREIEIKRLDIMGARFYTIMFLVMALTILIFPSSEPLPTSTLPIVRPMQPAPSPTSTPLPLSLDDLLEEPADPPTFKPNPIRSA